MKRHKIGIITLAVTLISLGIILLIRNFIDLNTSLLLSILWPSVIILFGLEIVIGKVIVESKKDDVRMTVDSLSIILLVIIVVITSIVTSIGSLPFRINGFSIFGDNGLFYSHSSVYRFDYEFEDNKNKIYIDNSHGNIEMKKITGDKIKVHAEVRFNHNNEDYADEISPKIVRIDEGTDELTIRTIVEEYTHGGKIGNLGASYIVEVPREIDVDIINSFGDISIKECAKQVDINSKHTNISLSDINGNVDINNSFGYVDVRDVKGIVNVYNKHSRVDVQGIDKDVIIENSYAQVKGKDIIGNVKIINVHDSIDIQNVGGTLDIDSKYSDIRIDEVNQGIKILNKHGKITYEVEKIVTDYIDIKNEYGDVRITLLKEQEGKFKAYTKYGDIYNDFNLDVDKNTTEQNLLQTIGKANIRFDIETTHGDLHINNK